MQCNCGASTTLKTAVRTKQKAELAYQECPACGRVEIETLKVGGQIVARGRAALEAFAKLDQCTGNAQ